MNIEGSLVYIVDDEVGISELLEACISEKGYEVQTFKTFSECTNAIKFLKPDLIVSDLVIQGESSLSFLANVLECYPSIKVQIISGFLTPDRLAQLASLNFDSENITAKPFDIQEYVQRILI